ncbi:MAG: hypothetical protein MUO75_03260, partial [Actinobacteria bacterium]|nr:hypothetical protein [Actinomycetota bacterium]
FDGRVGFESPVLCEVCAGLLGYVPGGFGNEDEKRWAAIERVEEELRRRYRRRRGALTPVPTLDAK